MAYHQSVWEEFIVFFSASTTQKFLKKCYEYKGIPSSDSKSFEASYPFIYYLEHAHNYYSQAKTAPISIKPNLLFYGFGQLIKACLLTVDPLYPESTTVLAHGVSTRKRKKQQYEFLYDEVKLQKSGLLTHFAEKMFHMKHLEGEKILMEQLLKEIPEMNPLFFSYFNNTYTYSFEMKQNEIFLSSKILDIFHMSPQRFEEYLISKTGIELTLETEYPHLKITLNELLSLNKQGPFRFNIENKYFSMSLNKESICFTFPEILIHYLLLYNLSMIARYETEWWLEMLKTMPNSDYPFISRFLNITQEKGPFLILTWLNELKDII